MLEKKIEELTNSIDTLIALLRGEIKVFAEAKTAEQKRAASEPAAPVAPAAPVDRKELQAICLAAVRRDRALKSEIKAILSESGNGAAVLADVPDELLPTVRDRLVAL